MASIKPWTVRMLVAGFYSPDGGIGIRTGFKSPTTEGSTPSLGTEINRKGGVTQLWEVNQS